MKHDKFKMCKVRTWDWDNYVDKDKLVNPIQAFFYRFC